MDNETFTSSEEAIDFGRDYEYLIPAYYALILSLNEEITDFKLSSNNDAFGDFDDVVIETTLKNGEEHVFAMQLKHVNRPIAQINLITNKKFKLKKYSTEFETIKAKYTKTPLCSAPFENIHFILFSNSFLEKSEEFHEDWKKLVPIADKKKVETDVFIKKIDNCFAKDLLNTCNLEKNVIYKFKSEQEGLPDEEFFKQFYFYTEQRHAKEVGSLISETFYKIFKNLKSNVALSYTNYFNYWCKKDYGNLKLTKEDVQLKIAELILTPYIPEPKIENLHYFSDEKSRMVLKLFLLFDLVVFDDGSDEILDRIWGLLLKQFEGLVTGWTTPTGLYITEMKKIPLSAFSENFNELTFQKMYTVLWHNGSFPMVIKPDSNFLHQQAISRALGLITNGKNKFVLINDKTANSIDTSRWKTFTNLSDILDVCDISKTLVETMTISVQGRPKISLLEFIETDENLINAISTKEFIYMLDKTLTIGDDCKKNLPKYYINRYIPKILLTSEVVEELKDDIFVISYNGENSKLQNVFKINTVDLNQYILLKQHGYQTNCKQYSISVLRKNEKQQNLDRGFCILAHNGCTEEDFENICSMNGDKNCHHVRLVDEERVEWVYTNGDINDLKNYKINVKSLKSDDFVEDDNILSYFKNRLNIICADPGMGKTTIITALKFLSAFSHWVITINLYEHVMFFEEKHSIDEIITYFVSFECKNQSLLVERIVTALASNKKLFFLWDGFDEIPREYQDSVIEAVKLLKQDGYFQWLAARTSSIEFLETTFNTFALSLTQFSQQNQYDYVSWHLKEKYQNSVQVEEIINKINENITTSLRGVYFDYTGIPLHIHMLIEIYLRRSDQIEKSFITLTDLYQQFIDSKFDTMFERAEADFDNPYMEHIGDHYKNSQLNQYEIAALKASFGNSIPTLNLTCDEFLEEVAANEDSLGLIIGLTDDKKPHFAHKTYEEFLTALWLYKNWKNYTELVMTLFKEEYRNVRFMFDMLLAGESHIHLAVLYRNLDVFKERKEEITCKDEAGRNALHVACSWGRKHPLIKVACNTLDVVSNQSNEDIEEEFNNIVSYSVNLNKNVLDLMDILTSSGGTKAGKKIVQNLYTRKENNLQKVPENTITVSAKTIVKVEEEDSDYLEIINFLLKHKCDPLEKDELFKWNAIEYADKTLSLAALDSIITQCHIDINSLNNYNDTLSLLHYSVAFLYHNLLEILTEIPYVEYTYPSGNSSLLQLACEVNNINAVAKLLNYKCYKNVINNQNAFLGTPLLSAALRGNLRMIKILLDNGAQVNTHKSSPIVAAAFGNKLECCKKLLEAGADVNGLSADKNSSLMTSVMLNQSDISKLLLDNGADVNFVYRDLTVLQTAVSRNDLITTELLLKYKPDINLQCKCSGYTALHYATQFGSVEMVKLLLDNGANPKLKTNQMATPLHIALICKKRETALELISADSSVVNEYFTEDELKLTPMIYAAINDFPDVIVSLAKHEADIYGGDNCTTPLHIAAEAGSNLSVVALIKAGASVNQKDKQGLVPLFSAIDNLSTFKLLLDNSADITATSQVGETVLHIAAYRGKLDIVKELVQKGSNINAQDNTNDTPLLYSIRKKNLDVVKYLLDNGAICNSDTLCNAVILDFHECIPLLIEKGIEVNGGDQNRALPLFYAVLLGNSCVKVLLENGADPNIVNNNLQTMPSLHIAASRRDIFTLVLLTSYDANVNATITSGLTPLHCVCSKPIAPSEELKMLDRITISDNNEDCAKELIRKGAKVNVKDNENQTPLHLACANGYTKIIKFLIENDAVINATNNQQQTPLHICFSFGLIKDAEFLVQNGAKLDVTDKAGKIPVDYALDKIDLEEIKTMTVLYLDKLRKFGANFNYTDRPNKSTLLHLACGTGNVEVVQYLLNNGADIESKTSAGFTPLWYAAYENHKNVVLLLLEAGCNADTQTPNGNTLLHLHAAINDEEMINILAFVGINPNIQNIGGYTALHVASYSGAFSSCESLLNFGADIEQKNPQGKNSFQLAISSKNVDLVKLFINKGAIIDNSALFEAVFTNDLNLVKLLVEKDNYLNFNENYLIDIVLNAEPKNPELLNYLLENGLDPNFGDPLPLLHKACKLGCYNYVQILVKHRAEVNSCGISGATPLMIACLNNHLNIVLLLLDNGAKLEQIDSYGWTALFYTCLIGNLDRVKLLPERGSDLNALTFAIHHNSIMKYLCYIKRESENSATPLHEATDCENEENLENHTGVNAYTNNGVTSTSASSRRSYFEITKLLIESNAELDTPDSNGNTPLFFAAAGGFVNIVKLLFENGAKADVVDNNGMTALHIAAHFGRLEVVQYLVSKKADLSLRNKKGKTPLNTAIERGHESIAEFLTTSAEH